MGAELDPDDLTWAPPGPGQWYPSQEHLPRPISGLMSGLLPDAGRGWRWGSDRYGLPPNTGTFGVVNAWGYWSPGRRGDVDLDALEATAAASLAERRWRTDLARWRDEVRPAVTAASRALLTTDLAVLDDAGLAAHVGLALDHFRTHGPEHFASFPRGSAAIGALLQATAAWGIGAGEVITALAGASPASSSAERLLERMATGLRASGGPAPEALDDLRAAGGDAAAALDELLLEHAWRCFEADLLAPTLAERPDAIVAGVRAAQAGWAERRRPEGDALDALRARVPPEERDRFDELAADARAGYGDNDDNSVALFSLPLGIIRRAALEVGRRLVARGRAEAVEHVLEARPEELVALADGGSEPGAGELARRHRFRLDIAAVDPPVVGEALPPEPPLDLPPSVRELDALLGAFRDVAWAVSPDRSRAQVSVGSDVVRGRAVVVVDPTEAALRMAPGDVLVALTTSAPFNTIFPIAGAVAVQVGTIMSHAAVLARELGLPAVIGVPGLLQRVADGDLVEVDPVAGTIRVVEPG